MNEKEIQRRIFRITVLTVAVSLILIVCAGVVITSMLRAEKNSYEAQMKAFINEYKINMERQMDSDIESLETLAGFISNSRLLELENLADGIDGAGTAALFLRLGYCEKGSDKIRISMTRELGRDLPISERAPELQEVIEKGWNGENATSQVYMDVTLKTPVIAYSVPVYDESGILKGCLLGVRALDVFQDILNETTLSQISLDVAWLDADGNFVGHTEEEEGRHMSASIFSQEGISEKDRSLLRENIAMGRDCTISYQYGGSTYGLYLEPLDRNDWYLLCIDDSDKVKSPVYFMLLAVAATFLIILVLSIASIWYGSRILRKNNRELIRTAYYDSLTGLFNMKRFEQEASELLEQDGCRSVAALNIRHFRYINEIFGKKQADQVLCELALIIRENIREDERFCRYNGDQFCMLLHTVEEEEIRRRIGDIMKSCERISRRFNRNYPIQIYAGAAVNQVTRPDELIDRAEFALKQARQGVERDIVFYDEKLHKAEELVRLIESSKNEALEKEEFRLFLQPKRDLASGEIASAEALVRWIREDGSVIFPDQFIPLFELNGFCAQLDLYMVAQVCRKLRQWEDEGRRPISVSVNQSKLLFYQSDYVERLCQITEHYNIPRSRITLEILEGLAAESIGELNKTIMLLKNLGFKISLDDFGSGYSSLNLLTRIGIDEVKLDRGFLEQEVFRESESQAVLMKHIVNLARDLSITTVVEGVETAENEAFIRSIGVDYGQGYYYSRPIPSDEFAEKYLQ